MKMTENDAQTRPEETPPVSLKEIKRLLWIGIISVWVMMVFMLYMESTSSQIRHKIDDLSVSRDFSALADELGQIRTQLSDNAAKTDQLVASLSKDQKTIGEEANIQLSRLLKNQEAMANIVKANIANASQSVGKWADEQKAIRSELSSNVARMNQSVETLIGEQKAMSEAIRTELSSNKLEEIANFVKKLASEQDAVIEEIKGSNIHNTQGMRLLKKFVENQTSLLGQILGESETTTSPEATQAQ